jgi:hypothetical protein
VLQPVQCSRGKFTTDDENPRMLDLFSFVSILFFTKLHAAPRAGRQERNEASFREERVEGLFAMMRRACFM